ncbi:ATP-binding protein [Micromonospora sp. WMMD1102]|uniref:sensor histidine kinase n=1 Tax=Micromonospora sp. WMMD1102 TaxID=3016105 RepID=UPI0024150F83|nr:ATP-binding protein [Micromonospora sp. WMMD1102]MDG4786257.1 ATP-binding protein [Micromonospora sp. WMMD1102]
MRRPWRTLSLRARLTVISATGLAAGLAVGGLVLLGALGYALQRTVDTEALKTAEAVARLAGQNALPDPLPVAGSQVRVQVLDGQSRIRAASIDADRLVPMLYPDELRRFQSGERDRFYLPGRRLGLDGPVRVVAVPAGPANDPQTVLVAKSTADVRHSVTVVRTILLVSFPLLLVALTAVAWRVVGATLRPVETLRAGAEEITGGARPGRLPLPASHDEIHRLAVTLNGMLGRLESARARQRAFVADAAHELRSPLANLRTQLEVAQRLGPATEWPAVADDLLADIQRLSRLVDDLLLLARFDEAGAGPPRAAEPVELAQLLTEVAERYPAAPLRVLPPASPCWVLAEPDALTRVLGNLLDNALRHTGSEVVLAASARPAGSAPEPREADPGGGRAAAVYHLVTVTDDGPGIPAGDRDRVFDRFTRLDDARARDAGGAGLGLAIVRELVRRQGGTVSLGDAGPGLRVEVRLPAVEAQADDAGPLLARGQDGGPDHPDDRTAGRPSAGAQRAAGDLPGRAVQTGSASPTSRSE